MNDPAILVDHVSRSFQGRPVLRDLNLAVQPGSIYGFLGRNGAGKTTTLRLLAGLIRPGAGTVRVLGHDPFAMGAEERQWLGYMSEKAVLPPMMKVRGLVRLCRALYPHWDEGLVSSLLGKYGISPKASLSALSAGNQRLLGFILAIAPRPKVLLLDEPAANLDVVARREILDDILDLLRETGATVLFSTHVLSDVERVADEIGILAHGTLQVSKPLDELKESVRQVRFFGFRHGVPAGEIAQSLHTVRSRHELLATVPAAFDSAAWAAHSGCEYESRALNLEDIFVELSRYERAP